MRGDAALPRGFLRPCVLLLLRERSSHGYDLLERLPPLGFEPTDPGRLYRTLRALETGGLARSAWEQSESGPARRVYEITREGMEELHAFASDLHEAQVTLGRFLGRYGEFAAIATPVGERTPLPR